MTHPNTLRVDAIVASKTNPRKHFDKAALQELAESIAKHGVLQAILVRPNGSDGTFELVAGERRWRAAQIAGLERIPATVRELEDAEVLEIQVVENLQRADLHPLEEAEGYEALMKCHHPDGRTYTADEIAAKVGKSKSYVYQRLKLTALTPKSREAFYAGRLDASRALLVARVPESLQDEALGRIAEEKGEDNGGWAPTFREARDIIHDEFMLGLKKPPFDVKAIYFEPGQANPIGTPCGECPKRTGNQPELFEDVKSGDICTDPACFRAKTAAHTEKLAEKHRAKGLEVLTGEAARKVMPHTYGNLRGGYVRVDEPHPMDPKAQSIEKRLGKALPPVTLIEHPHNEGEFVRTVEAKAAREALVAAGHDWAKEARKPAPAGAGGRDHLGSQAQQRTQRIETACELALHKAVREAVGRDGLSEADLRFMIPELLDVACPAEEIAAIDEIAGSANWDSIPVSRFLPMLVDCALPDLWHESEARRAMAERHGVDVDSVLAKAREEFEAKAAAEEAKKVEAKPAKPKKAKKTKGEEATA